MSSSRTSWALRRDTNAFPTSTGPRSGTRGRAQPGIMVVRWRAEGVELGLLPQEDSGGFAETIEVAHMWRHIEGLHTALKAALAPLADEVLAHFSHVYTQGPRCT